MPAIDTELIEPLTAITDTLRRRPGIATMQSIKKLSETYGFTTFVEHIRGETGNVIRMSISGHVLLIDIDFKIPQGLEAGLGSPMSPTAASGSLLGEFSGLDRTSITHVSISSAITPDLIDGVNWDFLVGFGESESESESVGEGGGGGENRENGLSCSDVLYDNLTKEKTMDAFNKNLRVLLQFDRLSGTKPSDLFTIFSELAWGMTKQIQLEEGGDVNDRKDGVIGLGKVLCNYRGKVGLFLKYWVDDRYVNRWIKKKKKIDIDEQEYLLHFKVRESLKKEEEDEKEGLETGTGKEGIQNSGEMEVDSTVNSTRLFNVDFGEWNIEKGSKTDECLSNITLELCPPIWVPEDLLLEFGVEYETIVPGRYGNYSADLIDEIYNAINETGDYSGNEGRVKVSMLVGCPMLLVHKTTLCDLNQMQGFVQNLRTWCKVASVLRKLPSAERTIAVAVSCGDVKIVEVEAEIAVEAGGVEAGVDAGVGVGASVGGEKRGLEAGRGNGEETEKRFRDLRLSFAVAQGKVLRRESGESGESGERESGEGESGDGEERAPFQHSSTGISSGISNNSSISGGSASAVRAVELAETLLW